MLIGYNNDVQYRNKTFHIQTEDRGMGVKQIETQIFHSGAILDTRIVSYEELIAGKKGDGVKSTIRTLMQTTHKELFKNLMQGHYDDFVGLEPLKDVEKPEAVEEDFKPAQERVPDAVRILEEGGEVNVHGANDHMGLDALKEKLSSISSVSSSSDAEEEEDETPTQITSLDSLPELLQARAQSTAQTNPVKLTPPRGIISKSKPSVKASVNGEINLVKTGKEAWRGCQEASEELSLTELVEAFVTK